MKREATFKLNNIKISGNTPNSIGSSVSNSKRTKTKSTEKVLSVMKEKTKKLKNVKIKEN
jgi:hypothetical protein